MPYEVLKAFSYSEDGVSALVAAIGDRPDIPSALVPGLIAEGYIREAKALDRAPENKMLGAAPENKAEFAGQADAFLEALPAFVEEVNAPDAALTQLLTDDEINADIMAMPSVDFDPREPKAERLSKRNAGRAARDAKAGA